ncbi:MAG: hypothetical protein COA54_13260 [Thiotrichaceae bacterium]|nr:MAG: hypothetical protein COA54_13260 [Thiotrichaceae bacterium]
MEAFGDDRLNNMLVLFGPLVFGFWFLVFGFWFFWFLVFSFAPPLRLLNLAALVGQIRQGWRI